MIFLCSPSRDHCLTKVSPGIDICDWEDNLGLSDSTENKIRSSCNSVDNLLEVMLHAAARWRRQFLG